MIPKISPERSCWFICINVFSGSSCCYGKRISICPAEGGRAEPGSLTRSVFLLQRPSRTRAAGRENCSEPVNQIKKMFLPETISQQPWEGGRGSSNKQQRHETTKCRITHLEIICWSFFLAEFTSASCALMARRTDAAGLYPPLVASSASLGDFLLPGEDGAGDGDTPREFLRFLVAVAFFTPFPPCSSDLVRHTVENIYYNSRKELRY